MTATDWPAGTEPALPGSFLRRKGTETAFAARIGCETA